MSGLMYTTLDYFFSFIFLTSFYFKVKNMLSFSYEIKSYKVVPPFLAVFSVGAIIILEFSLAIIYAFHIFSMYKEVITISLFMFFTVITYKKKQENGIETCNCFGRMSLLNKNPIYRNLFFIFLSVIQIFLMNPKINVNQSSYLLLLFGIMIVTYDIWDKLKKIKKMRISVWKL